MTEIINFDNFLGIDNMLNQIIHGDCLEVMKKMPDKCIDVIITSPPYNLLKATPHNCEVIENMI